MLYPPFENSTTRIVIVFVQKQTPDVLEWLRHRLGQLRSLFLMSRHQKQGP